jgi:hypothetical protein
MRAAESRIQVLRDLRFALEVMEERSHLGLNDERAIAVKAALLRRIGVAESGLHYEPSSAILKSKADEVFTA